MIGGSIRTPDQRLRVFVSSTLAELAAERARVREAIERRQLTPVLFELGAPPIRRVIWLTQRLIFQLPF